MNLTIGELLSYTDEERAKWENWFRTHGNDPVKLAVPMEVHPTVGALIAHCFWAELFYAQWMRGDLPTQERMKEVIEGLNGELADELFEFGSASRKAMREAVDEFTEEDWQKTHKVEGPGFELRGSARKLIAHILVHEIRHWAQVALTIRQHGLVPPGDHDLLFSESFGPLIRKL